MKYMGLSSSNKEVNEFRGLSIRLVDKKTGHKDTIASIQEKFDMNTNVIERVTELNKLLGRSYKGKYSFDFCLDEGKSLSDLNNIKGRKKESLMKKYYQFLDEFDTVKIDLERKLKDITEE